MGTSRNISVSKSGNYDDNDGATKDLLSEGYLIESEEVLEEEDNDYGETNNLFADDYIDYTGLFVSTLALHA